MAIEARPINGSVLAFKTTNPTNAVPLFQVNLLSGMVTSDYFKPHQLHELSTMAQAMLAVIDLEDRALTAPGLLARLVPLAPLDGWAAVLNTTVSDNVAYATVPVAGTRYFAAQIPHSIVGGMGFSEIASSTGGAQGGGELAIGTISGTFDSWATESQPVVVGGSNIFFASSPESLTSGILVARNPHGNGVVRASSSDPQRMPAVGAMVGVSQYGYTIQTSGPITGYYNRQVSSPAFVGADGFPTTDAASLEIVQPIGGWVDPATLILSLSHLLIDRRP